MQKDSQTHVRKLLKQDRFICDYINIVRREIKHFTNIHIVKILIIKVVFLTIFK